MTKLNPLSRAVATAAAIAGACLLGYACPAPATAAGQPATAATAASAESTPLNLPSVGTASHSSGSGGSIVRTIVGLAIVIAVIWGLSWILRQVKSGREPHLASTGLTSVAALPLGTGRSVHLVRAGNDFLLLGSAEHGVVPIHRYSEEEARRAGLLDAPVRPRRALLRPPASTAPARPEAHSAGVARSAGARPDPMRMPSPGSGLIDRLRELTVRH
jgi:flagellar protein FliO/FliZ